MTNTKYKPPYWVVGTGPYSVVRKRDYANEGCGPYCVCDKIEHEEIDTIEEAQAIANKLNKEDTHE